MQADDDRERINRRQQSEPGARLQHKEHGYMGFQLNIWVVGGQRPTAVVLEELL
jgi:hypothetical protein